MPMKEDPEQNFNSAECNCNPLSNKIHSFIIYYDYTPPTRAIIGQRPSIVLPYNFFHPFPCFCGRTLSGNYRQPRPHMEWKWKWQWKWKW